jgi:hypothetical protein
MAFYGAVKAPNVNYMMFLSDHHPSATEGIQTIVPFGKSGHKNKDRAVK